MSRKTLSIKNTSFRLHNEIIEFYHYISPTEREHEALLQVKRLKPNSSKTQTLELDLLSRSGQHESAARRMNSFFDNHDFDFDRVQVAFAMGYRTRDWPLAIRALEMRNQNWPETAVDGHFQLGMIYAGADLNMAKEALAEFQIGLSLAPTNERDTYVAHLPEKYRNVMR